MKSERSTCHITEVEDPGGCQQTDPTDAEPEESPRPPRRLHPCSRRAPVLSCPPLRTCLRSPLRIQLACCSSWLLYSWLWSPSTALRDDGDVRPGIRISAFSSSLSVRARGLQLRQTHSAPSTKTGVTTSFLPSLRHFLLMGVFSWGKC